ncbi:hypothetical protein PPERSA_07788 [Pseudocohnilembus persalinus]|uniref:Uncharacterized protein n=1 Tax=Pseudocohnilembus persalinus TaxID=266149 RepID=A0A0V0QC58_PSEPJ|nr:hypothetical protein PPERSA_07788 [Pseudocohnilembus persalinus]|eukprot:KRW99711.1 hypothetical protein PPERSA_07788 [Pseudocohnilembus persalinus]
MQNSQQQQDLTYDSRKNDARKSMSKNKSVQNLPNKHNTNILQNKDMNQIQQKQQQQENIQEISFQNNSEENIVSNSIKQQQKNRNNNSEKKTLGQGNTYSMQEMNSNKIVHLQDHQIKHVDEVADNRPTPSFRKQMQQNQENISPNSLATQQQQQFQQQQHQSQQGMLKQNSKKKIVGFNNIPLPKSYFTQSQNGNNNQMGPQQSESPKQLRQSLNFSSSNSNRGNINSINNNSNNNNQNSLNNQNNYSRPRVQSTHSSFLSKSHSEMAQGKLLNLSPIKPNSSVAINNMMDINGTQQMKLNKLY